MAKLEVILLWLGRWLGGFVVAENSDHSCEWTYFKISYNSVGFRLSDNILWIEVGYRESGVD